MIVHGFGKRGESVEDLLRPHGEGPFFIPQTRQVHGNRVVQLTSQMGEGVVEADAFVATEAGVVCPVATADCVPVLIWDAQERVVAAVHAGWRGVAAKIVPEAVNHMREFFPDAELRVAMGPAMAASCYEVGAEVVAACAKTVADISPYLEATRPGHHRIDLKGILLEQLGRAGVPPNAVDVDLTCTHCNADYASFRRGDRRERQFSWIVIL